MLTMQLLQHYPKVSSFWMLGTHLQDQSRQQIKIRQQKSICCSSLLPTATVPEAEHPFGSSQGLYNSTETDSSGTRTIPLAMLPPSDAKKHCRIPFHKFVELKIKIALLTISGIVWAWKVAQKGESPREEYNPLDCIQQCHARSSCHSHITIYSHAIFLPHSHCQDLAPEH